MRIHNLVLAALCASFVMGATVPAMADGDWYRRHREEWREHEWREHAWREHQWRERNDWEHRYFPPPVATAPTYGYYAPPPVYYGGPGYYR